MRRHRPTFVTIVAVAVALLVAGCGSHSPNSSTSASGPTPAQLQRDAVAFTDCMRSHGVSNFPDPTSSPREFKIALNPSSVHSPAFPSAMGACHHLLPGPGPSSQGEAHSQAQIAVFLAFARCIRSHGFPSFPDPTNTGELTHEMVANAGINVHQPAVLRAGDACVDVTHGLVTKADVARFVAGH